MPKVTIIRWDETDTIPRLVDAPNDTVSVNFLDISGSTGELKIGTIDADSIVLGKSGAVFVVSGSSYFQAALTASAGMKITASIDLPGQQSFSLDGVSVSTNNFTAGNLSRLFNGSNVDDLHSHAANSSSALVDVSIYHTAIASTELTGTQIIYLTGDSIAPASANNVSTSRVIGIVSGSTSVFFASGTLAKIHTIYGNVFNNFSNLIPGSVYYLSSSAGRISTTIPQGGGKTIAQIGIAKSSTELFFQPLIITKL